MRLIMSCQRLSKCQRARSPASLFPSFILFAMQRTAEFHVRGRATTCFRRRGERRSRQAPARTSPVPDGKRRAKVFSEVDQSLGRRLWSEARRAFVVGGLGCGTNATEGVIARTEVAIAVLILERVGDVRLVGCAPKRIFQLHDGRRGSILWSLPFLIDTL